MEDKTYTITFTDSSTIENLRLNGNNFVSSTEITADMFDGNMSEVIISDGAAETILHNAELIQIADYGDLGWYFILREIPAEELEKRQTRANIDGLVTTLGCAKTTDTKWTVDRLYNVGEYLTVDGTLYRVTLAIPAGGRIAPGANCVKTTISDEITKLNQEV